MVATSKKLSNKALSASALTSESSFTPSKLRFLEFRKVAIKAKTKQMNLFREPKQPKTIKDGLSLEIPLVIQLL